MKKVSKWKIRRFNFGTWFMFGLACFIGCCLGPIGGMFCAILAFQWLAARQYMLRRLKREYGEGLGVEMVDIGKQLLTRHDETLNFLVRNAFYGDKACRTCGTLVPVSAFPEAQECPNRTIGRHNPFAAPPNPNPFKNWWFKIHGFVPPPDNWPEGEFYVHPYAHDSHFLEIAKEKGKEYWLQHENDAWNNGYGNVPDYYIDTHVERIQ